MSQIEHLFWYDPVSLALQHEAFEDSAPLYTRMQHICQAQGCNVDMWNLQVDSVYNTWYSSAGEGGSAPFKTNLHVRDGQEIPKDICVLCTLLNLNWRTD